MSVFVYSLENILSQIVSKNDCLMMCRLLLSVSLWCVCAYFLQSGERFVSII